MKKQIISSTILLLGLIFLSTDLVHAQAKVNSNYNGVQVGVITYSYRDMKLDVEGTLKACMESGISSIELMGTGVEAYLGAPENPLNWREVRRLEKQPEEKQEAFAKYQEEIKVWRYAEGTMKNYEELRKKFNDAGVNIHIYKWTAGMSDEDLDYSFKVAKALGAIGITTEIGEEACTKVGAAAERAGMLAIFHNHYQYADEDFDVDKLLALNPANRLNFDIGHYYGSTGKCPVEFIQKYHEQIASIHVKDKTGKNNETDDNANQVFGQGETPIKEVLQLIRDNKWPIHCDIELEYEIAPWSTSVKEVNTCREYCRQALL
jgi:sugar phosphate isomerase/epimerase